MSRTNEEIERSNLLMLSEFLKKYNMSRAAYYRLIFAGKAPKRIKFLRKVAFTKESINKWLTELEKCDAKSVKKKNST